METRANYVLLGAFTILAGLAVIAFSLWISKARFADTNTYDIVFVGPISGLAKGGDVRFNGIKVGEVKDLRIDEKNPQDVVARVSIEKKTPVRSSSEAKLEGLGFTGVTLIQITAGDPRDPLLESKLGQPPPRIIAKRGSLDDLLATGKSVAAEANEALAKLNRVLTDENIKHLSDTIENIHTASARIADKDGAIDQMTRAAASIADLSEDTHGKLDHFSARADATFDAVNRAANDIGNSADLASTQALPNVSAAARDLRRLSSSLEQLTGDLADGQTSLIPGASPAKPVIKVRP